MFRLVIAQFMFLSVAWCLDYRDSAFCDPKYAGSYTAPHPQHCDKYISCQKGGAVVYLCEDGLAYLPYKGCRPLHTVDCSSRPLLQTPKGTGPCFRRFGIFPDPRGCGRFFKCVNDSAVPDKCSPGLMFDEKVLGCRESTKDEVEQCQQFALLGCNVESNGDLNSCTWFRCPVDDPYPFGDHSRHPYPGNCGFYILCVRGGSVKIQGCPEGTVYSPTNSVCVPEKDVPPCKLSRTALPIITEIHQ